MRKYKNILNVLAMAFLFFFWAALLSGCGNGEGPVVLTFKIKPEDQITKQWKPKTALKYATKSKIPAPYNPEGKIDPFANPLLVVEKKVEEPKPEPIDVPETALTKWDHSQLTLTGTIINHTFRWAAFITPAGGQAYKGQVGDYVGKDGLRISSIDNGVVVCKNKDKVHSYRTFN